MEGSSREEGIRPDSDLGNTKQHTSVRCWHATLGFELLIFVFDGREGDDIASHEVSITWFVNHDATKHLTNNYLKVFGGNFITVSSINGHNFVHNVTGSSFGALELQLILEVQRTGCETITSFDGIGWFDQHLGIVRNFDANWSATTFGKDNGAVDDLSIAIKWGNDWFETFSLSSKDITSFNIGTVFNLNLATFRNFNLFGTASSWGDLNHKVITVFPNIDKTRDWSNPSLTLW